MAPTGPSMVSIRFFCPLSSFANSSFGPVECSFLRGVRILGSFGPSSDEDASDEEAGLRSCLDSKLLPFTESSLCLKRRMAGLDARETSKPQICVLTPFSLPLLPWESGVDLSDETSLLYSSKDMVPLPWFSHAQPKALASHTARAQAQTSSTVTVPFGLLFFPPSPSLAAPSRPRTFDAPVVSRVLPDSFALPAVVSSPAPLLLSDVFKLRPLVPSPSLPLQPFLSAEAGNRQNLSNHSAAAENSTRQPCPP